MRLLYCYTKQDRSTTPQHFMADGRYWLMRRLVEEKIVDSVDVIVHGARIGRCELSNKGVNYLTIRYMNDLHVAPGDVVWVRGGFKPTAFYEKCVAQKAWLVFYGANTGRARWPFWDVVLSDLCGRESFDKNGRLYLYYPKPINPNVFKPRGEKSIYDVCLGASHITDKKGQWMAIQAAIAYFKQYQKPLRCVMPGAVRRGVKTNLAMAEVRNHPGLRINLPGMVQRPNLADIFNKTRLFVHCGSGQNDRGLLEAMRCGTPCYMTHPVYHDPFTYKMPGFNGIPMSSTQPEHIAKDIHDLLVNPLPSRQEVFDYFEKNAGIETSILPKLRRLFSFFRNNPVAIRADIRREYQEVN